MGINELKIKTLLLLTKLLDKYLTFNVKLNYFRLYVTTIQLKHFIVKFVFYLI